MWLISPTSSTFTGLTIRNTFADGINFYSGAANSVVSNSVFRNTGIKKSAEE